MSIYQYNTEWWRLTNFPRLLQRIARVLKKLPDNVVVVLAPVGPFLLLINHQVSYVVAALLTSVLIGMHHLANSGESRDFSTWEPDEGAPPPPPNPIVEKFHAEAQRIWQAGVRERLVADANHAEVYATLLSRMNSIPDVIGFTTGMCEQWALKDISSAIHLAGLTAECELAHVLYAYAMGWTEAPLPGTGHGAFTRPKAIRVLRRFPDWPDGWEVQLSRVVESLRPPPVIDRGSEEMTALQWSVFVLIIVPMFAWFYIEDLFERLRAD